jgi:hypothetical protein
MIISETILIKTFKNKKLRHYLKLGYDISKPLIDVNVKDLPKSTKDLIIVKCDYCDSEHERTVADYNRIISKNKFNTYTCSRKCGLLYFNSKNQNIIEHPLKGKKIDEDKLKNILEKRKKTNLEKWGVEHPLQNKDIKDKFKKTHIDLYGTDNYSKTEDFIEKHKNKCLEKWGVDHHSKSDIVKLKKLNTNLERWNLKSTLNIEKSNSERLKKFKSEKYREKYNISKHLNYLNYNDSSISIFKCDCNKEHTFEIKYDNFKTRLENKIPLCTICNPIGENNSIKEKELIDFIKSIYNGEIITSYRDGLEIDIFITHLNIGFEFNGIWWHSDIYKDKWYHLNKLNFFKERGIRVINIWEDDWIFKKEIIKSQIRNLLGISNKIWARKCHIQEIKDVGIAREFLDKNHIQGFVKSDIKIGLFYQNEIVSIMTFDKSEGRKKMNVDEWNLSRFCNKSDNSVIGGASKLLKFFITTYKPKRIISYADKDWSGGYLYHKIGFNLISETNPDYRYLSNNRLVHKSKFRKSYTGLSESKLLLPKVWNCGKMKFEIII